MLAFSIPVDFFYKTYGALNGKTLAFDGIIFSSYCKLFSIFCSSSSESANNFYIRAKFVGFIAKDYAGLPPLKKPKVEV